MGSAPRAGRRRRSTGPGWSPALIEPPVLEPPRRAAAVPDPPPTPLGSITVESRPKLEGRGKFCLSRCPTGRWRNELACSAADDRQGAAVVVCSISLAPLEQELRLRPSRTHPSSGSRRARGAACRATGNLLDPGPAERGEDESFRRAKRYISQYRPKYCEMTKTIVHGIPIVWQEPQKARQTCRNRDLCAFC